VGYPTPPGTTFTPPETGTPCWDSEKLCCLLQLCMLGHPFRSCLSVDPTRWISLRPGWRGKPSFSCSTGCELLRPSFGVDKQ
jgi:hypothetical protein